MTEQEQARMNSLEAWLQWCLDNCDDSPEWNFGTDATEKIRSVLRGESVPPPNAELRGRPLADGPARAPG